MFLWRCLCGGVFCGGVFAVMFLCFCGGVFVVLCLVVVFVLCSTESYGCRNVLWGSVVDKCCGEVLQGRVVKKCCGEVL